MEVKIINHKSSSVSRDIYEIFQLAYRQEVDLLGVDFFPPLLHSPESIRADFGVYYGVHVRGNLVGVLHLEGNQISALTVHPVAQRIGVASCLIKHVQDLNPFLRVATGLLNAPALALYQKFGFKVVGEETRDNIDLVHLET